MAERLERPRAATARPWVSVALVPVLALVCCSLGGCSGPWRQRRSGYMDSPDCRWPSCVKHCDPCPERRVGHCLLKLLGADLRYQCNTNRTECVIGRCVCKKGWCAGPYSTEGLAEADPSRLRSCIRQECYEGARPPPDVPAWQVQLMASLAPAKVVTLAFELKEHPILFLLYCSIVPLLILIFGIAVAILMWVCLCAGHGCCRGTCGFKVKLFFCGHQQIPVDCTDLPSDHEGDMQLEGLSVKELKDIAPRVRPSVFPLLRTTLFIATCCAIIVCLRQIYQEVFMNSLSDALMMVHDDARTLGKQAGIVNHTVAHISEVLNHIQTKCFLTDPILVTATKDVAEVLAKTSSQIDEGVALLQEVPALLRAVEGSLKYIKPWLVWVPVVPQIVVGAYCVLLIIPSLLVCSCHRARVVAHVFDLFLLWSSIFAVLVVLIVTVFATAELVFGVAGSVICLDVDRYAMHYAREFGKKKLIVHTARHYIRGDVVSPIEETIDDAVMKLNQVMSLYSEFKLLIDIIGFSCLPLFEVDVPKLASTAKGLLGEARTIAGATNIWPYWHTIVQDMGCHQVLRSTAVMVIAQVAICLVLFPLAMLRVHHFLIRKEEYISDRDMIKDAIRTTRIIEREQAKAAGKVLVPSSSSSESDSGFE